MKSPFPGMDPYLENYWHEVHQRLIIYTGDFLQANLPAPLRARIESGEWQAITNDACLGEFRRVLAYPMFALSDDLQQSALAAYGAHVTHFTGSPQDAVAALPRCSDRDDQKFLELARDSAADWLITADKALLRLARRDRLRGLFRILTPEMALTASRG